MKIIKMDNNLFDIDLMPINVGIAWIFSSSKQKFRWQLTVDGFLL